jgi:ATP-binding cassette subfamily B protein
VAGAPLIGTDDVDTPEWAAGLDRAAKASLRDVARGVPAVVVTLLVWAWRASPRLTVAAGATQLLAGCVTAFGFLATADVFSSLLAGGPTPERVLESLPALAVVIAAMAGRAALDAAVGAVEGALIPLVEQRAQDELYRSLGDVELAAFDDADFTQLVERSAGQAMHRIRMGAQFLGTLVAALVALVAAIVSAGLVDPLLAPAVLLGALPQTWASVRSAQVGFGSFVSLMSHMRRLEVTGELIAQRVNAAEMRAFTLQPALLAEHRRILDEVTAEHVRVGHRQNLITTVGRALSGIGVGAGYVVLGVLLVTGRLPLPLAGTAVITMRAASAAVTRTVFAANHLFEAGYFVELYGTCLAEVTRRRRPTGTVALTADPAEVRLRGASFGYPGQDQQALVGIDLTLRRGEVIALVGENGSGKSTLAKLITGLYLPTSGEVCWDGVPTSALDDRDLHDRVAVVMQEPVKWPVTAENNIRIGRLGRLDPDSSAFADAATRSGADAVLTALPDGASTMLSRAFQRGRDLSGGQWQRLSVARGLYRDAAVVIADEPTAAMDARAEDAVFRALRAISAGRDRITVLVTHRLANIRGADRIVVLEQGRLIEQGRHEELMALGGTYQQLFTLQANAYLPQVTAHP